jgi:hypothetical protein
MVILALLGFRCISVLRQLSLDVGGSLLRKGLLRNTSSRTHTIPTVFRLPSHQRSVQKVPPVTTGLFEEVGAKEFRRYRQIEVRHTTTFDTTEELCRLWTMGCPLFRHVISWYQGGTNIFLQYLYDVSSEFFLTEA